MKHWNENDKLFELEEEYNVIACNYMASKIFQKELKEQYSFVPTDITQNLGAVNGLVVQASNIGTLAGPPCAAALASGSGWQAMAPMFLIAGLTCAMLGFAGSRDIALRNVSNSTEK